jgi:hypothetical protein
MSTKDHLLYTALHAPHAVRRNLDGTRGRHTNLPSADDDYNAGAAALGPSLITAVNHPDTTLFWDYVILGLVALGRQWNRYDASVAERAGRAEGRLVPDAWASIGESE